MIEGSELANLSDDVASLLTITKSSHFHEDSVLTADHVYWQGSLWLMGRAAPKNPTESDVLRWLCIHHMEQLSDLTEGLRETESAILPYQGRITQASKHFGIEPPRRFANYHQFALYWVDDFLNRWQFSWSTLLNPVFPFVDRFDPSKAWVDPSWDGSPIFPPKYSWDVLRRTAEKCPEAIWNRIVPNAYMLFPRMITPRIFPFDEFFREVACVKQFPAMAQAVVDVETELLREIVSTGQIADAIDKDDSLIRHWANGRKLPNESDPFPQCVNPGRSPRKYRRSEVTAWLDRNNITIINHAALETAVVS